jgi:hypothetical protein
MKKNWKHIISTGNCPSIDKLLLYYDGKLSREESFSIENHLAGCMICSDVLDGISELPSFKVLEKTESEIKISIHKLLSNDNRTRKTAVYRRLAIAASIVLFIGIPILIYQYTNRNKNIIMQHITEAKIPSPSKFEENKKEYAISKPQNRLKKAFEKNQVQPESLITKDRQLKLAMAEVTDSTSVLKIKTETTASGTGSATDEYQTAVADANKSVFQSDELSKSTAIVSTTQSPVFDSGSDQKPAISEKSAGKSLNITYDESNAQNGRSIAGKVTDRAGIPMPGVNVYVQGSTNGTVTDIEGRFKINIEKTDKILSFSFIGFKPESISLGITDTVLVAMNEETSSLDEVVIVKHGNWKKSLFTSAASKSSEKRKGVEPEIRKESELQIDSLLNILSFDKTNKNVLKEVSGKYIEIFDQNNALNKLNDLNSLLTDPVKRKDIEEIINLVHEEKYEDALKKLKKLSIN